MWNWITRVFWTNRTVPPEGTIVAFLWDRRVVTRRAMVIRLSALLTVFWFVACDDPPQQPPVACGSIPSQRLNVAETGWIKPCFEDPEMGTITLSVESSAPEVVAAVAQMRVIQIDGVSPGNATITITATDAENATGVLSFVVLVPNRPPVVLVEMPPFWVLQGTTSQWVLSGYFADPDNQNLTYEALSSDVEVASISVSEDILTVVGRSSGVARVSVTATDPGGLAVTQEAEATVGHGGTLFQDDFESEGSLDDWEANEAALMEIDAGMLRLTNTSAEQQSWALMPMETVQWEVAAAMGNAHEGGWVELVMLMEDDRYSAYLFQIGDDDGVFGLPGGETNYRFLVYDLKVESWTIAEGWFGKSDAINGVGELTDVTVSIKGGQLSVTAGTTELVSFARGVLPEKMTDLVLGIWPEPGETGGVAVFDWVEVFGFELATVTAADRRGGVHDLRGRTRTPGIKVMSGVPSNTIAPPPHK